MLSRKRLFRALVLVGLYLAVIGVSNPVEFSPVQATRLDSDMSAQPEMLIGEPLSLPGSTISLAPAAALTTTVTAAEAVDIIVRETTPGEPLDISAYGPDGPVAVTVEVVAEEDGELFETPEAETAEEVVVEGEPPPDGFVEEELPESVELVLPETEQVASYDNWEPLMTEDFENDTLPQKCGRYHAVDTPPTLDTWIKCGPYDRSQVRTMMVRYARWVDGTDPGDVGQFGYSTDGQTFTFLTWSALNTWQPVQFTWEMNGQPGQVWFMWRFRSDGDAHRGEGAWLDELEIWRYNQPAQTCGDRDPGRKGIVVEPYVLAFNQEYPIIRPGSTFWRRWSSRMSGGTNSWIRASRLKVSVKMTTTRTARRPGPGRSPPAPAA